ncbi:MAG TPA: hypothetical protein PLQ56_20120 [Aggregatilineales bacterium]|nr:hypothetical protein [Anaerolineae bacterium]HUN08923.1 hypothetical protein [Aggregatilineales bacterium]
MNRLKRISLTSRTIYLLIVIALIVAAVYAVFSTQLGQTALLICCGGGVLLVVVGIMSERGMRRPR